MNEQPGHAEGTEEQQGDFAFMPCVRRDGRIEMEMPRMGRRDAGEQTEDGGECEVEAWFHDVGWVGF